MIFRCDFGPCQALPVVTDGQDKLVGDKALLINTKIGDDMGINGYFILMPEGDSYEKILVSLGLPV